MKSILVTLTFSFLFFSSIFSQEDVNTFLAYGDSLFSAFDNESSLEYYQKAYDLDSTNYDACWKLSRAFVDVGETLQDEVRADYYQKSDFYAQKAVELNPEGAKGHRTFSIAIGRVALDAGAKERVRLSKEVKKEVDLAIKLDPNDDIAYHVLGRWNRKLANLSWIERPLFIYLLAR